MYLASYYLIQTLTCVLVRVGESRDRVCSEDSLAEVVYSRSQDAAVTLYSLPGSCCISPVLVPPADAIQQVDLEVQAVGTVAYDNTLTFILFY